MTGISSVAGSRFCYSREMAVPSSSHQRSSATPPEYRALRLTPRAKLGTIGLTQVLAAELGPKGTRVNAISPGGTDTRLARAMISIRKRSPMLRASTLSSSGKSGRDRAISAVSRLGRIELRQRRGHSRRLRRLHKIELELMNARMSAYGHCCKKSLMHAACRRAAARRRRADGVPNPSCATALS